jgi:hypothetical protein
MFTNMKKSLAGVAALGALALGGSAIAGAATSGSSNSSTTTPGNTAPSQAQRPNLPAHGTAAHEDAEKPVTGHAATKAKAAAVKSLGGGTAGEVTTDFTGDGYEVTVTKADGSKTEVHLDKSFTVMKGGPGHHDGDGPGAH